MLMDHLFKSKNKAEEALLPNLQLLTVDGNTMKDSVVHEMLKAGEQFRPDMEINNDLPQDSDKQWKSILKRHDEYFHREDDEGLSMIQLLKLFNSSIISS